MQDLGGYDPGASWQPANSAAEMRSQLNRERFVRGSVDREERDALTGPAAVPAARAMSVGRLLRSPLGMGLVAFLVVFLLLVAINPPLTQNKPSTAFLEPKPNLKAVALYAAIVGLLVAVSPYIARHFALPASEEGAQEQPRHRKRRFNGHEAHEARGFVPRRTFAADANGAARGFAPPARRYGLPQYQGARPAYGAPQGGYGAPQGAYGPQQGAYGPQQGAYGPPQGYGAPQGSAYRTPQGYGAPQDGYRPAQGYGAPQGGYGPPQGSYDRRPAPGPRNFPAASLAPMLRR